MSVDLKDKIKQDMVASMRAKDKPRLGVIRMLQAAIKQKEVDERITLGNTEILAVVQKMVKQRHESIKQFEQGNRPELAAKEAEEIEVLQAYLPTPLTTDELNTAIKAAIQTCGASSAKDMGRVMQQLKPQLQGRANMSDVSAIVKQLLES